MKKTKIVCTVGPATDDMTVLCAMLEAGMNVARFNFSHGTHTDHGKRIAMVREASQQTKISVGIMLDTRGPEMRLGKFTDGKVTLRQGQRFVLTSRDVSGDNTVVHMNHKLLPQLVKPGDTILLSDGLIGLQVEETDGVNITCRVLNDGEISDGKRLAAPGVDVQLPPVSPQDVADIKFGLSQGIDSIAASFVQRAADVLAVRRVVEEMNASADIIAKIENAAGVANIDEILKVADGIMVARGDLGVEIPAEEVPLVQKTLIEKCNRAGKPVITATQMLESMLHNPRPTRAEASDVANAILDGSDAIMLSGETASGQYPVEAVRTMARIAAKTETALRYTDILLQRGVNLQRTTTDAVSHATVQMAHELRAAAVITATESGYTARMVSKYRPQAPIIAVTPHDRVISRLQLIWGVQAVAGAKTRNTDEMIASSVTAALAAGLIKEGDLVLITAGVPAGTPGTTNLIKVHIVGNIIARGVGVGQRVAIGTVCVARTRRDLAAKFHDGDILVTRSVDEETAVYAAKAAAIIAEEGGLTSHAAIVGVSYGLPVVVGAEGATELFRDGMVVTVDAARGLIYQGEINAR